MAEPLDNLPDESQVQAPKALRDDLAALFGADVPVPPAVDAAVLAAARQAIARRGRARIAFRWAAAVAAAAALLLVAIHFGPSLHFSFSPEATARKASPSFAAAAEALVLAREDINGDGRVDILDAFALARSIEAQRKLTGDWDINGDGVVDKWDVQAIAAAAVKLRPTPPRDKGASLGPKGTHSRIGVLSPNGAYYGGPGQRPDLCSHLVGSPPMVEGLAAFPAPLALKAVTSHRTPQSSPFSSGPCFSLRLPGNGADYGVRRSVAAFGPQGLAAFPAPLALKAVTFHRTPQSSPFSSGPGFSLRLPGNRADYGVRRSVAAFGPQRSGGTGLTPRSAQAPLSMWAKVRELPWAIIAHSFGPSEVLEKPYGRRQLDIRLEREKAQ